MEIEKISKYRRGLAINRYCSRRCKTWYLSFGLCISLLAAWWNETFIQIARSWLRLSWHKRQRLIGKKQLPFANKRTKQVKGTITTTKQKNARAKEKLHYKVQYWNWPFNSFSSVVFGSVFLLLLPSSPLLDPGGSSSKSEQRKTGSKFLMNQKEIQFPL